MSEDDGKKKLEDDAKKKLEDDAKKKLEDDPKKAPGPVPYERFAEVNEKFRVAMERLSGLETAQKTADEKRLIDEKKWQELAERRSVELKQERTARLRFEVAAEARIPAALASRIQGEDKAAMMKDAKSLLEFLKSGEELGMPPAPDGGEDTLDLASMTPEEIRKNAGKLWGK